MFRVIRALRHVGVFLLVLVAMNASAAHSQTTAFTYQGQLSEGGMLASGSYDLRFALFDSAAGGAQIGANQNVPTVPVSAGVFTLQLDFGVNAFPGANRFVEIGVKPAGGSSFTTLAPRQQISSSPYAIRTLSAATADALSSACVGCVKDTQIQGVAGSKVSGAIPAASVPSGSGNYIQNTTTPQAGANFNIGGSGTIGTNLTVGGALNANGSGLTNLNAVNITTGTLNNARLGLIPTANIADSAVTAPKLASGQVVKSLNTLKDDVTLAEGSNITITPAGNALTIASTSGGVGGSGTTNTIPVWSAGTTLGNSGITQSSEGVQLPNGVQLGVGAQGNQVRFGSPNGETGMSIQGASGRADLRFDGMLKLVAGPAGFVPPSTNGLAITTAGNVGIGTTAPTSKLEIAAQDGLKISGFQPFLTLRDTNGGNKSSFVQGVNGDAALLTNSRATLIVKDISGNVGIGTTAPALLSGGTGKLVSISDSLNPGIALTNTGARQFFLYSAGSPGSFRVFDATSGADRFTIDNVGNAKQERGSNGLVKAMVYADANGNMIRCYNSQLADGGASLPPSGGNGCGISVVKLTGGSPSPDGAYQVSFNFRVDDRFFSITPGNDRRAVSFSISQNVNAVLVDTYLTDVDYVGSKRDSQFMLIVY